MTPEPLLTANGIKLDSIAPGRHYTTCPKCSATRSHAHQGNKVLGVTIEADGVVHWGCNHCGWTGPEKGAGKDGNGRDGEGFAATYDYRDAAGTLLFQKVRNVPGREPRFWLRRPDGKGGWINSTKGVNTGILYQASAVARAITEGRVVAVVEGEKDANSVRALGIVSTCNAHGASELGKRPKWIKAHSEQLAGADIVVFNDNDAAGYAHAEAICNLSLGIAKRVRRLDLAKHWPEIPEGGDVSDWLALGHTREGLAALIEQAPDYVPTEQAKEAQGKEQESSAADAEITRLARLKPLEYEQQRKAAAERLDIRASILDRLVRDERVRLNPDDGGKQGHAIAFPNPEPWPDPVKGVALLDDLADAIRRHVVLSDTARDTAALWTLHTYLVNCFLVSPRLGACSPTKGCGKTLLFDVLGRLAHRPQPTANVTPAAIFRVIEAHQPTLLIDEADTFLHEHDELRGVLNGNRKGSQVLRTVGDNFEVRAFATYSACAIALIGTLPDTLHDRAVRVDLKRRQPSENIKPYRPDRADHLDLLARRALRWAKDHAGRIADADPVMPDGIINRESDNWRPLLAIADEAGDEWGKRARVAAIAAHTAAAMGDEGSRLEILLGDIRDTFGRLNQLASTIMVEALIEIEGHPWKEMGRLRKPLTPDRLARMLKPLGIVPGHIDPQTRMRGYKLSQFEDAFSRYLPAEGVSGRSPVRNAANTGISDNSNPFSQESGRTAAESQKPNNDGVSNNRTTVKGDLGPRAQEQRANGSDEPGLSHRRIRDLADQYQDLAYANAQANDGNTHTAACDVWLRQALAEEGVLPEFVETEFRRVMVEVFRV
jgi:Protein of unknown function (DUF3631)